MFVMNREMNVQLLNHDKLINLCGTIPPFSKDPNCLVWQLSFHGLPACCTLLLNLATRGVFIGYLTS